MKKQNVLIIGNKPYENFNLNSVVDSFDIIYRFNMVCPGNNNGTKFGKLAMCSHVYDNFAKDIISKEKTVEFYGDELGVEFLHEWYDFYKANKQNFEEIFYERIDQHSMNKLLSLYNCPYKFSKMPSTGYSVIFKNMSQGNNIYVLGFTICEDEIRTTQGEIEEFAVSKNVNDTCHSFSEERDILAWLHNNNKIDATLCMLEDTSEVNLKSNKYRTLPSRFILKLLNKEQE